MANDTAFTPLFERGEEARARRSGRIVLIVERWDNGSQMLYLIRRTDAENEPPTWVSGDMLRKM